MIKPRPNSISIEQPDSDSCTTAIPVSNPLSPDATASCSNSSGLPEVVDEVTDIFDISPQADDPESSIGADSPSDDTPLFASTLLDNSMSSLTCFIPPQRSSLLLNHYFSAVCQLNSAFDSSYNPFRSEVPRMMVGSPLLFCCVLSMSAAHFYQGDQSSSSIPLQFQTEALSHLSNRLSQMATLLPTRRLPGAQIEESTRSSLVRQRSMNVQDDVLLGIIILGMTSAWHDVSATGIPHLHGSRQLFKAWVASNSLEDPEKRASMSQTQNFLVSSMIYWEAMSSVLLDQEFEALSCLDIFCDPNPPSLVRPCPWTGVGTPVFVFLAKTVTLVRNNRALRSLRVFKTGEQHRSVLYSGLLEKASELERKVVGFQLPFVGLIDDTGDPCTPPDHFLAVSRCYRLAALLELYRAFPETVKAQTVIEQTIDVPSGEYDGQTYLLLGLAFGILDILEAIPNNSGTISTQLLALMIAGSVLGPATPSQFQDNTSRRGSLHQEIVRWRSFVRQRILYVYVTVGLRAVNHATLIIEEVWSRMDALAACHKDKAPATEIHWIDVMSEMRLETILG
ncbi:Arginine metabolism regulation protein II [Fusarium austroafricanum]|uniref:Arginine metabolism regulation protein II n=1 Tax=Fusarium austroafricanum TaxID=2364996 RepID=A0A8H4KCT7_9HYPO|nr:Arginine metabolism regulation protein II [Fusarium austroafricanum]